MTGPDGPNDPCPAQPAAPAGPVGLHHVELWVPDLGRAEESWGWLLGELGWRPGRSWGAGRTWCLGATYLVFEQSPAVSADRHERRRPGLNHLAFWAGPPEQVDRLVTDARHHGWSLMFPDRHPYAGGNDVYAAYLEDRDGYEVELVATARLFPILES